MVLGLFLQLGKTKMIKCINGSKIKEPRGKIKESRNKRQETIYVFFVSLALLKIHTYILSDKFYLNLTQIIN